MLQLGPKMAEVILDWFDEGLNVETFSIVGHSLGGQMSGVIGRSVFKKSRGETQISRISALDPAFPTFYPSLGTPAVNKNDAKFVVCLVSSYAARSLADQTKFYFFRISYIPMHGYMGFQ